MKKIYLLLSFSVFFIALSQNKGLNFTKCEVPFSKGSSVMYAIDANQLQCLSKNSDKQLLVYVFEWWCKPCNEKVEHIKNFSSEHNLDLIVLTLDSKDAPKNEKLLAEKYKIQNIAVLSNNYGKNLKKKYNNFLAEISNGKEYFLGLSKLLLYNKKGEMLYMSSLDDDKIALQEKILPLLE